MKITTISSSDKFLEENDWRSHFSLEVETEANTSKISFTEGEPEDNNLGRNFNDVYSIEELLEMAHTAGKNGEALEFENKTVDDWEEIWK